MFDVRIAVFARFARLRLVNVIGANSRYPVQHLIYRYRSSHTANYRPDKGIMIGGKKGIGQ